MAALLASVTFQNVVVFQVYIVLSRAFDSNSIGELPSYKSVVLAEVGTGALQSLMLSPVELVKIRPQLQNTRKHTPQTVCEGPIYVTKNIWKSEGLRGIYQGLSITVLRDAPALGIYFWSYEYARENLHPGCRKGGEESLGMMLFAGGLAGVASWMCRYPLDVMKSRLQAQSKSPPKYNGNVGGWSNVVVLVGQEASMERAQEGGEKRRVMVVERRGVCGVLSLCDGGV